MHGGSATPRAGPRLTGMTPRVVRDLLQHRDPTGALHRSRGSGSSPAGSIGGLFVAPLMMQRSRRARPRLRRCELIRPLARRGERLGAPASLGARSSPGPSLLPSARPRATREGRHTLRARRLALPRWHRRSGWRPAAVPAAGRGAPPFRIRASRFRDGEAPPGRRSSSGRSGRRVGGVRPPPRKSGRPSGVRGAGPGASRRRRMQAPCPPRSPVPGPGRRVLPRGPRPTRVPPRPTTKPSPGRPLPKSALSLARPASSAPPVLRGLRAACGEPISIRTRTTRPRRHRHVLFPADREAHRPTIHLAPRAARHSRARRSAPPGLENTPLCRR